MSKPVHVSEVIVTVQSPTSTSRPPSLSISSVTDNITYTSEQLDEKRENRRVYEYMCRLHEVRNWLAECLKMDNIVEEIELEANLSNGVLLAKLANYFEPEVAPLSKIYDIDQVNYGKEDQFCYKYTDNIMLWRRACKAVRFPEVFLPETVDIYEGRNVKTIFCLYALAIHLFRLRRAPPIRNQAYNVYFPPAAIERMREHLKNIGIPIFSDVNGELSNMPHDHSIEAGIVSSFKEALSSKDQLLDFLKNPDNRIIFVNNLLANDYYDASIKMQERLGNNITIDDIQKIVTSVNEAECLRKLDILIKDSSEFEQNELLEILYDLLQEGIMEHGKSVYAKQLYERRQALRKPLTLTEVENVVSSVNLSIDIKFRTLEKDQDALYELLSSDRLYCQQHLREDLKFIYPLVLKQSYANKDGDFVLLLPQIREIIIQAETITDTATYRLQYCNHVNDTEVLKDVLKNIDGFKDANTVLYAYELRQCNCQQISQAADIIQKTNQNADDLCQITKLCFLLNSNVENGNKEEAVENLRNLFEHVVRSTLMSRYLIQMEQELTTRKQSYCQGDATKLEQQNDGYIVVNYDGKQFYLNPKNNVFVSKRPEKVIGWLLSSEEIQTIINRENELEDEMKQKLSIEESKVEDEIINQDGGKSERASTEGQLGKTYEQEKKEEVIFLPQDVSGSNDNDTVPLLTKDQDLSTKEEAAKKIQRWLKRHKWRRELYELLHSPNPCLQVVRDFIVVLDKSEEDEEKENEISEKSLRESRLLEEYCRLNDELRELDSKICVQVQNRMNLETVTDRKGKGQKITRNESLTKKSLLTKKEKQRWNLFEILIFHLQTQPEYFARLIRHYRTQKPVIMDLFKRCIWPVFGEAKEEREEFLFLNLMCYIIKEDMKRITSPKKLKETFAATVLEDILLLIGNEWLVHEEVIQLKEQLNQAEDIVEAFNLNPEEVYEAVTGQKSGSLCKAVDNEEVRRTVEQSKQCLSKWSLNFANSVFSSHLKIPKIICHLMELVWRILKQKFYETADEEILQAISSWIYEGCFKGQIEQLKNIKNMDSKTNENIDLLKAIDKVMVFGASCIGYGQEKWYLDSLNTTILQINNIIVNFFKEIIREQVGYNDDKYLGLWMNGKNQPTLRISLPHLNILHRNLKEDIDTIFVKDNSPLKSIILDIQTPNADQNIYVNLNLHPLPQNTSKEELDEIFQRTKQQIIDYLRCDCAGKDLCALLDNATTEEEETRYQQLPNIKGAQLRLAEQKKKTKDNLQVLEGEREVTKADSYQAIVNSIAKEIKKQRQYRNKRDVQLLRLQISIEKLEQLNEQCRNQVEKYRESSENCSENMPRLGRRPSIQPTTQKASKMIERRKVTEVQKFKSSAKKLQDKKILKSIDKTDDFKDYSKVTVEIQTTDRPGLFMFNIRGPKKAEIICHLEFQDLLDAQYREEAVIKVGDQVNFNVEKLVDLLNTKFYSK